MEKEDHEMHGGKRLEMIKEDHGGKAGYVKGRP